MKSIELIRMLERIPLFTINDASRILQKDESYVKVVMYRLEKRGLVRRIERGKYTVHGDELAIASYIATPSYISFWTALNIHGLTEQLPRDIIIAVPAARKHILFNKTRIIFTKISQFWGYEKMRHDRFDIFIAEKEKAIIDSMIAKNVPFDEIAKAIASNEIDYDKLVDYAKKVNNISLIKRIGHIMERYGKDADELLGLIDNNIIPLDWSFGKKGKKDKKWKLIINNELNKHDNN